MNKMNETIKRIRRIGGKWVLDVNKRYPIHTTKVTLEVLVHNCIPQDIYDKLRDIDQDMTIMGKVTI